MCVLFVNVLEIGLMSVLEVGGEGYVSVQCMYDVCMYSARDICPTK